MLKYVRDDVMVTFAEVPGEISLCLNLSGCRHNCVGCHSPYLREDVGEELTVEVLNYFIARNRGITVVCLMGGSGDTDALQRLARAIKANGIKACWYTGDDELPPDLDVKAFDFIKTGHYDESLGPLSSRTTNQRFYRVNCEGRLVDETSRFWR